MWKNHLTIAIRNLLHQRLNTFINVLGLGIGLACVMMLLMYVEREYSYDDFHDNGPGIFRVTYDETVSRPDGRQLATTSPAMAAALKEEHPEVLLAVRLRYPDVNRFSYEDKQFYENNAVYAEQGFFQMFSFPFQSGNAQNALAEPNSVVLTHETAVKYFGSADPVDKVLEMDGRSLKVTGVLEPISQPTHLVFDFIISFSTFEVPPGYPVTLESWTWISFHTYVLLNQATTPQQFEQKLTEFKKAHFNPERLDRFDFRLQNVKDIYFGSARLGNNESPGGNKAYLTGLSSVALLILLLAGFNFMNITTARSIRRSREVGVRKVMGASRRQLVIQFLSESVVLVLLAFISGIFILEISEPWLNDLLNLRNELSIFSSPRLLPGFAGLAVLAGILAGLYPSLVLSRFKPAQALKPGASSVPKGFSLQKGLILFQFLACIVLITLSFSIGSQMKYLSSKSLGFEREHLLVFKMLDSDFLKRYQVARQVLLQNPNVASVSAGDLFDGDHGSVPIFSMDDDPDTGIPLRIFGAYYDYFSTAGIELKEGREFQQAFATDSAQAIMVNAKAVEHFGWDNPIGKQIRVNDLREGKVIGVTEDFHFSSLHSEMEPLIIFVPGTVMENILVRVKPGDFQATLSSLENDWNSIAPDLPFQWSFADEAMNRQYQEDEKFANLIFIFSAMAMFIAAIGLYGLVSVITQYRVREIGIRKVLGAGIQEIVYMLCVPFTLLVAAAAVVAAPLSYWSFNQWLANFAFRVEPDYMHLPVAVLLTSVVALSTVGWQAYTASKKNPVESLRYE